MLSNKVLLDHFDVLNAATAGNYKVRLENLSAKLGAPLYDIIRDPAKWTGVMSEVYISPITRRNITTAVLTLYRLMPVLGEKKPKAYQAWVEYHKRLDRGSGPAAPVLTRDEVLQKYNGLGHATLAESVSKLLLSMILHHSLRNLHNMKFSWIQSGPEDFMTELALSRQKYPRKFVFVNKFGEPFTTPNAFVQFVIAQMQALFHKKIGLNHLKNI